MDLDALASLAGDGAGPRLLAITLLVLLAGGFAFLALRAQRARGAHGSLHDALVRIEQRLADVQRDADTRGARLEQRLLAQERELRDEQARALQSLERRLAELTAAQSAAGGELASVLAERGARLEHGVSGRIEAGNTRTVAALGALQTRLERRHAEIMRRLHQALQQGLHALSRQLAQALARSSDDLGKRMDGLALSTDRRLESIGTQVEQRLSDGFQRTTETVNDVLRRLALIDEAQKRLTELSGNVVSLQELLADKRSRGAFGEVQLNALVANVMPPSAYALQHTLSNGRRADCVLFLPEPTGTIAIDSKFPLESFQRMTDVDAGELERERAARRFRADVRAHVRAIAERYIVPGETADGAIMFVPAEAVFAEIQAHHPEVVQAAHRARVWLASPTTLVAILNTARAVLKDDATRRQMHVIRRHLAELARDFDRFRQRMDRLATHMDQANRDVQQVNTSAAKISRRFQTIEEVEMDGGEALAHDDAAGEPAPARRGVTE